MIKLIPSNNSHLLCRPRPVQTHIQKKTLSIQHCRFDEDSKKIGPFDSAVCIPLVLYLREMLGRLGLCFHGF